MKKKPDSQRDQRREIIESRKKQVAQVGEVITEKPPTQSKKAPQKQGKKKGTASTRNQRREIIQQRKAREGSNPQKESPPKEPPSLPPSEAPVVPPRTMTKGPTGEFPLPKGFVPRPAPPAQIPPTLDPSAIPSTPAESPVQSTPPSVAKPKEKRGFAIPTFEELFPDSDKNQINQYKMMAGMLCIACIIAVTFTLVRYVTIEDTTVTSVVYVDINPSIAIELNKSNDIIQAIPQNAQAAIILGTGNLEGQSLDEGLAFIVGLLNLHGYIQETSTLLVTVEDENQQRGETLSISAKETLDQALNGIQPEVTTLGQWADPSYEYDVSAEEYEISFGKRVLIEEVSRLNYFFQVDSLVPFSTGELYQLYASGETVFPIGLNSAMELGKQAVLLSDFDAFVVSIHTDLLAELPLYHVLFQTATAEYLVKVHGFSGQIQEILEREVGNTGFTLGLTQNQGKEAALTKDGKLELQVDYLSVKHDWSKGRLQYLVCYQELEHQVDATVLASTGEVIDHKVSEVDPEAITDLGQSSIQDVAFADAGVKRSELSSTTFKRSQIDGVMVYELTFWHGNREYYYQVSGTGLIIQSSFEDYGEPEQEAPDIEVTETTAKNTALDHAGATFSQVNGLVVGRDISGNFVVEFSLNSTPYSYQISNKTGEILSYDKSETQEEEVESDDIGGEEAKIIALAQENLKEVMIQTIDLTFEGMGESKEYHIAFDFNGFAYYYIVAATTGEVLHQEKQLIPPIVSAPEEEILPETNTEQQNMDDILQNFDNMDDLFADFNDNFNNFW